MPTQNRNNSAQVRLWVPLYKLENWEKYVEEKGLKTMTALIINAVDMFVAKDENRSKIAEMERTIKAQKEEMDSIRKKIQEIKEIAQPKDDPVESVVNATLSYKIIEYLKEKPSRASDIKMEGMEKQDIMKIVIQLVQTGVIKADEKGILRCL